MHHFTSWPPHPHLATVYATSTGLRKALLDKLRETLHIVTPCKGQNHCETIYTESIEADFNFFRCYSHRGSLCHNDFGHCKVCYLLQSLVRTVCVEAPSSVYLPRPLIIIITLWSIMTDALSQSDRRTALETVIGLDTIHLFLHLIGARAC